MRRLFVCPIMAIKDEIEGSSAYYILCTMYDEYEDNYPNALKISFLDPEVPSLPWFFTVEMAKQIVDFFQSTPPDADVFVCCDCDESRSAAIAGVLMRSQGGDEDSVTNEPFFHPNRYIYFVMCKYLNLPLYEGFKWEDFDG